MSHTDPRRPDATSSDPETEPETEPDTTADPQTDPDSEGRQQENAATSLDQPSEG